MSAVRVKRELHRRVCQGDVIRDVEFIEHVRERNGYLEVSKVNYPLVVVLTQDCDLQQDYTVRWSREETSNQDKAICSVLVAPVYNAEHVFLGEHLSGLALTTQKVDKKSTQGKNLCKNQLPRYHYLDFPAGVQLPAGVVDFKHYFSVAVSYLKKRKRANFVCQLAPLYREDLSLRFSNFLARIGLPNDRRPPISATTGPNR